MAENGAPGRRQRRRVGVGLIFALGLLAAWIGLQLVAAGTGGLSGAASKVNWTPGSSEVLARAKSDGQPVLLEFTADWCPPCQWMNANVYSKQRVASAIERRVVPVQVDMTNPGPTQQKLARQWQVRSIPTLILLDGDGDPIARRTGRMNEQQLLDFLENTATRTATTQPTDAAPATQPSRP
jgi:thiol:disulfide interchange protein